MTAQLCRIDLSKTHYQEMPTELLGPQHHSAAVKIYHSYCEHHNFDPHHYHPLWPELFHSELTEVLGYRHCGRLVAFSIVFVYAQSQCCEADQFAWDYAEPGLKLGYRSVRSECARYKARGFRYLYLGEVAEYKKQLQGFELVQRPHI